MPTIHFTVTTTSTPEQFVAGLTDFGPGRQELFANSADSSLEVHEQGPGHADVTEGSVGIWERLAYDWSDPNRIVLTTTDSNVFGGRSGHTYTLTRRPDGTTEVDVVVVREGKNLRGRLLSALLGSVGRGLLEKRFKGTVTAIEARNRRVSCRRLSSAGPGAGGTAPRAAPRRRRRAPGPARRARPRGARASWPRRSVR